VMGLRAKQKQSETADSAATDGEVDKLVTPPAAAAAAATATERTTKRIQPSESGWIFPQNKTS